MNVGEAHKVFISKFADQDNNNIKNNKNQLLLAHRDTKDINTSWMIDMNSFEGNENGGTAAAEGDHLQQESHNRKTAQMIYYVASSKAKRAQYNETQKQLINDEEGSMSLSMD